MKPDIDLSRRQIIAISTIFVLVLGGYAAYKYALIPYWSQQGNGGHSETTTSTCIHSCPSSYSTTASTSGSGVSCSNDPWYQRTVFSKVYENSHWLLSGNTADQVGKADASLCPTYVESVIRLGKTYNQLNTQMIMDYNTIRNDVLAVNPNVLFGVQLSHPVNYNVTSIQQRIANLSSYIHIDVWLFDFWSPDCKVIPTVCAAAITEAHSLGQKIGGENFGANSPAGVDYLEAVNTVNGGANSTDFNIDYNFIKNLENLEMNVPVFWHIASNPQNGPSCSCAIWIDNLTFQQRVSWENDWARNQTSYGYVLMYNAFYPDYPVYVSYNSIQDSNRTLNMVQVMQSLINVYNP